MSYNIDNICWPHVIHMVIRVGCTVVSTVSRSLTVDFILFFIFIFILLFSSFSFNFLFLEQLGLGVISHAVTSVTKLMA